MAEKQLNAWVVLGGRVDNSFQQLGQNLVNLGGSIDGVSQKLINFGKESVKTYRGYEDSMLEAQVALSTNYGRGTKALQDVMGQLDRQASEWAATTIFHTDDVANAIAEAAHANWDLDKIITGLPAAMKLAQAGSLDLSTGLDYIIKSTNAAGIGFDELGQWIDEWTYAANSSAGDVEQFGEAMLRMGSTMKFADNKEELLTMLAVLHDAGTTGANAGTLLRNSMIRMIAPTKKASDVMAELGVSESDISEAMAEVDGDVAKTVAHLEELGFSAYDSQGNLKDFTAIFEDLNKATSGMTDAEKYDIWSSIFPTRTITGAMALMEAAGKNWNGLLDDLNGGKASGYGKYASETMMSGLTGGIETFNSKVEELERQLGQQLAPQLENILGNFGKVVDLIRTGGANNGVSSGLDWLDGISNVIGEMAENMAGLDPALFDAIVGGLGSIASLGPMLTVGGLAIRGIGTAMSVFTGNSVGRLILIAATISTVGAALKAYDEAKFLENFGDLSIDTSGLDEKLKTIHDAFEDAKAPTQGFADALKAAVENYEAASTTFSATMMEDLLQDQTLTGEKLEEKLAQYRTLGSDMVGALKEGIRSSADMSAEFWAEIFMGRNGTEENLAKNEVFAGIISALDTESSEALAKAEAIGSALQSAINKAWEDGNLDESEREKIKEYFRQLNEAMAEAEREAQAEADYAKRRSMMDKAKAQGMDYGQMNDYITGTITPQRDAELQWWEDNYKKEQYAMEFKRDRAQEKYDELMAAGRFQEAQKYGQLITQYNQGIAGGEAAWSQYRAGIYSEYDKMIMDWFGATLADSELAGENGETMAALRQVSAWMTSGQITNQETLLDYLRNNGVSGFGRDLGSLATYYENELAALGGIDEVKSRIAAYTESGDESLQEMAKNLEGILAIYGLLTGDPQRYSDVTGVRELTIADFDQMNREGSLGQGLMSWFRSLQDEDFYDNPQLLGEMRGHVQGSDAEQLNGMLRAFGDQYNLGMITHALGGAELPEQFRDEFAISKLLGMSEEQRQLFANGGAASNYFQAMQDYAQAQAAYQQAETGYHSGFAGSYHDGLTTTEIESLKMDVEIKEKALAEAQAAYEATQGVFAEPVEEPVTNNAVENAKAAREQVVQIFADPINGSILLRTIFGGAGLPQKEKGGRETEPAIFAEAGIPEWYIPEEHTPNTARLLAAAAANSGFSLIDLAQMSGARLFADGGTDGGGDTGASLSWGSMPGSGGDSGSSGGGDGGDITIQYSPVIHAANADGVEQKLKEDKERFRRWFNEIMAEKEMYRSMVAYQ